MKKRYIGLTGVIGMGALVMAALAMPARGEGSGPYFNADAGVALADDVALKRFGVPVSGVKVKFDTGFRVSVGGGYNFNEYIGVGLETGFIYNSVDMLKGSGGSSSDIDSSLSHIPLMANVTLRYDKPDCKWVPYLGFGAGADVSILTADSLDGVDVDYRESDVVFAWQAFAGVRYKITPSISIGAGYKYYRAESASWDADGVSDTIKFGAAGSHNIVATFNWSF